MSLQMCIETTCYSSGVASNPARGVRGGGGGAVASVADPHFVLARHKKFSLAS